MLSGTNRFKVNGENKMKKLFIIMTLTLMAKVPAISFAGDYWNETPDLNSAF
jgi:hypothetical protein